VTRSIRFLFFLCTVCESMADTVNVYFLWGQSNAHTKVADGAREVITASDPTARVFRNAHGGKALFFWYRNGAPQTNLINDFAFLDARFAEIRAEGHTPVLKALLVSQGESDRKADGDRYWAPTFKAIIALYEQRYGIDPGTLPFCLMLSDLNRAITTDFALEAAAGLDAEIRPAQVSVAQPPRGCYVDSFGYGRYDVWHLYHDEYLRLGRTMARTILGLNPRGVFITGFHQQDNGDYRIDFEARQFVGEKLSIDASKDGANWQSIGILTPTRETGNSISVTPPAEAPQCLWRLSRVP
jgi:hypothetical protein